MDCLSLNRLVAEQTCGCPRFVRNIRNIVRGETGEPAKYAASSLARMFWQYRNIPEQGFLSKLLQAA